MLFKVDNTFKSFSLLWILGTSEQTKLFVFVKEILRIKKMRQDKKRRQRNSKLYLQFK